MYSGSRVAELAQFRTEAVITSRPIPVFSITDEGESLRGKSDSGIRVIPIHQEPIRLGFLEYVVNRSEIPAQLLFSPINEDLLQGCCAPRWSESMDNLNDENQLGYAIRGEGRREGARRSLGRQQKALVHHRCCGPHSVHALDSQ